MLLHLHGYNRASMITITLPSN